MNNIAAAADVKLDMQDLKVDFDRNIVLHIDRHRKKRVKPSELKSELNRTVLLQGFWEVH